MLDPRKFFDRRKASSGNGRKTQQLCRQIHRTLDAVIADADSEILESLLVESVKPAGGSGQMLVLLRCDQPTEVASDETILTALAVHEGRLRSEVAASITRKKTPMLIYRVLPRGTAAAEQ